jgi:hypothetical protein
MEPIIYLRYRPISALYHSQAKDVLFKKKEHHLHVMLSKGREVDQTVEQIVLKLRMIRSLYIIYDYSSAKILILIFLQKKFIYNKGNVL